MGNNYYAQIKVCPTCKTAKEVLHIGKSSAGWKFAFAMNGDEYHNVKQLKKWLAKKGIKDEYGHKVSHKVFWKMVEDKQKVTNPEKTDAIIIDGYEFYDREFS